MGERICVFNFWNPLGVIDNIIKQGAPHIRSYHDGLAYRSGLKAIQQTLSSCQNPEPLDPSSVSLGRQESWGSVTAFQRAHRVARVGSTPKHHSDCLSFLTSPSFLISRIFGTSFGGVCKPSTQKTEEGEGGGEFIASLGYIVNIRPARTTLKMRGANNMAR